MKWYLTIMACMIGTVLMAQQPQPLPQKPPATPNAAALQNELSLMELIATEPSLSKFRTALLLSSLDNLVNLSKPLTIFAPSNAAFDKLPPEKLHQLYQPQNLALLQDLIKNHIVKRMITPEMLNHLTIQTMQGSQLTILKLAGGISIGDNTKIQLPPLKGSNGLIYIIDNVLYPSFPAKK